MRSTPVETGRRIGADLIVSGEIQGPNYGGSGGGGGSYGTDPGGPGAIGTVHITYSG